MEKKEQKMRVAAGLTRDQVEYLGRIGTEAKFAGGKKLGSGQIVRAMLSALREIGPDVSGVRTEDELVERILRPKREGEGE